MEDASHEEVKETQVEISNKLEQREFTVAAKVYYQKVVARMLSRKAGSNDFGSVMRIFRVLPSHVLGFPLTE
jgi:hypothetical protein